MKLTHCLACKAPCAYTASDKTSDNKVVVKLKLSALGQALAESTVSKHRLSPTPRRTNHYKTLI